MHKHVVCYCSGLLAFVSHAASRLLTLLWLANMLTVLGVSSIWFDGN